MECVWSVRLTVRTRVLTDEKYANGLFSNMCVILCLEKNKVCLIGSSFMNTGETSSPVTSSLEVVPFGAQRQPVRFKKRLNLWIWQSQNHRCPHTGKIHLKVSGFYV